MPSPNAAKKTSDNMAPNLAKRKSQDFGSKIHGWMKDVGETPEAVPVSPVIDDESKIGELPAKIDPVITSNAESPKNKQHKGSSPPKGFTSPKAGRDIDYERKAWVRKRSKPQAEITDELKQATTPRKRLVSDGNWRKDGKPVDGALASPETTPKSSNARRSVATFGFKVPTSSHEFTESKSESRRSDALKNPRSRSPLRPRDRGARDATPDYEDSGMKVYVKPRKRSRTYADGGAQKDSTYSGSSLTAGLSTDRSISTGLTTPSRGSPPRPSTAPREQTSKRSLNDEDYRRGVRRTSGNSAPDAENDPSTPTGPVGHGNRIQGWLSGTPDPFTESNLTPEPLSISKRSSRESRLTERDGDSGRRTISGSRLSSRPKPSPMDLSRSKRRSVSPDEDSPTTPTLQRRGAQKSIRSPFRNKGSRDLGSAFDRPASSRQVSGDQLSRRTSNSTFDSRGPTTTRGGALSTILSEDSYGARHHHRAPSDGFDRTTIQEQSTLSRLSDGDEPRREGTGLKRRLTKHSDLMSVLSLPRDDKRGLMPARSIRGREQPTNSTVADVMNDLTTDELKYQRELRTLVDGVIPVLLTYVLQKSDATGAKRLFSGTSNNGHAVTKPIIDMGVSLERLKAAHKRIPLHLPDDLVRWADGAAKAYADYLRTWRLGYQDIVVNLAPADERGSRLGSHGWDAGVPRNKQGDLIGGDGERVDVAYLLKRPLVRLKYLQRTLKIINQVRPSAMSEDMSTLYHELVVEARRRANEERARLEDEAAASIDPTRARDLRTMGPLTAVEIDPTRSVRARDYYDLDLVHSSGQQLGCKIEMIVRDDAPERGNATDILFCEISIAGRWLLFPPFASNMVSARRGDEPGQMIVMCRGYDQPGRDGKEWRELISLYSQDEAAIVEWLEMLGSSPNPSRLSKKSSFTGRKALPAPKRETSSVYSQSEGIPEEPEDLDVPIGEQPDNNSNARRWDGSDVNSSVGDLPHHSSLRPKPRYQDTAPSTISEWTTDSYEQVHARAQDREDAHRSRSRYQDRPYSGHGRRPSDQDYHTPKKDYKVWMPSSEPRYSGEGGLSEEDRANLARLSRPTDKDRKKSSVPTTDMPNLPRMRQTPEPTTPRQDHFENPYDQEPSSAPAKMQKRRSDPSAQDETHNKLQPSHEKSDPLRSNALTTFKPAFSSNRRSSSPLKHEYEPSTASESLGESDLSDLEDIESVTSAEEEGVSTVGELRNFKSYASFRPPSQPPSKSHSPTRESLGPSESASQAPYRNVPAAFPLAETVACLFSWADEGVWSSLHPEECTIVVTPGLIEAFDLHQAHAVAAKSAESEMLSPSARGVRPLVALELTPLVPLRRGTALDISIRSPPTQNSMLRPGNNVMFRSRTVEECEKLYSLINRARIDNPTFIALQNARGAPPQEQSNWGEVMDRNNDARPNTAGSSWWKFGSRKGSTYRSQARRPQFSRTGTADSAATGNSTASAIRRLSGGGRFFDIAKSTLIPREGTPGTRSSYSDSLSSGAATPVPMDQRNGTPLGLNNAKIRLYYRENASKWRDLGSASLTVLAPPRNDPAITANPKATGNEKRVIVIGKSKGDSLLDATLGESCFERVARTGIAVSVWEELVGANGQVGSVGAVGGVGSARSKVYMIQMASERDAAYTFSLVGKQRY